MDLKALRVCTQQFIMCAIWKGLDERTKKYTIESRGSLEPVIFYELQSTPSLGKSFMWAFVGWDEWSTNYSTKTHFIVFLRCHIKPREIYYYPIFPTPLALFPPCVYARILLLRSNISDRSVRSRRKRWALRGEREAHKNSTPNPSTNDKRAGLIVKWEGILLLLLFQLKRPWVYEKVLFFFPLWSAKSCSRDSIWL